MQYFIEKNYEIDYLILIEYDYKTNFINFEEYEILNPNLFFKLNPEYNKLTVTKPYMFNSDLSSSNNNLAESSINQLLKEDDNIYNKIKQKNSKELIIKNKNDNKKYNSDLNDYNKNDIDNVDNEEENTDEFHDDEKFHAIHQKYYKNLSLREIKPDNNINKDNEIKTHEINVAKKVNEIKIGEKNKENEEKKENFIQKEDKILKKDDDNNNKYLFNESQLIINLSDFEVESLMPVGIINPSVYCFMICIFQVLLSIPELNYYFLSHSYQNKSKNKSTPYCDNFQDFIKLYLLSKKYIKIPRALIIIANDIMGGMRMHDCQEFLLCFLEALQDELIIKKKTKIIQNVSMEQRWIIYRNENNSFLDSIFTGLMRSSVQCKKCNHISITYDPFLDLSVSINKYKNLDKCLKQFFENEKIDSEYKCEKCKQVTKVSKFNINF